jgi:hypothetical protein
MLARSAGKLPRESREAEDDQPVRKGTREPDQETNYHNWCKFQALKIVNAGRSARNLPLLKSLDGEGDPTEGDDNTSDEPKDTKSKKKIVKKKADEDEDAENEDEACDEDKQKSGAARPAPGETETDYWKRVAVTAKGIVRAGRRRRNEIP